MGKGVCGPFRVQGSALLSPYGYTGWFRGSAPSPAKGHSLFDPGLLIVSCSGISGGITRLHKT